MHRAMGAPWVMHPLPLPRPRRPRNQRYKRNGRTSWMLCCASHDRIKRINTLEIKTQALYERFAMVLSTGPMLPA